MEEDRVIVGSRLELWLIVRIRECQLDLRARKQTGVIAMEAQRRQILARDWIVGIALGAGSRDDVDLGRVKNLVGIRESGIDRTAERRSLPDVNQAPRCMARFHLGDRYERGLGSVELSFLDQAGQESHAGNLDRGVSSQIGCWAADAELVFAECGLGGGRGNCFTEDARMTCLIVADLDYPLISLRWVAGSRKSGFIEGLNAILVKGIDGPLSAQEVLEEQVVGPWRSRLGGEDGLRVISWKGRIRAIVTAVIR